MEAGFQRKMSTAIEPEVLQDKLAQLLQEGELRKPISDRDRNVVVKIKRGERRVTDLSKVFEEASKTTLDVNRQEAKPPGILQPRRGFAEKMFKEVASGTSIRDGNCIPNSPLLLSMSDPCEEKSTASPTVARLLNTSKPLPIPEQVKETLACEPMNRTGVGVKANIPVNWNVWSSLQQPHPNTKEYDWGSLGPPAHLAKTKTVEQIPKIVQKPAREVRDVRVISKESKSVDLIPSPSTYIDSEEEMQDIKQQSRWSLTGSQIDTMNRVHSWRTMTSLMAPLIPYAASANATEPSGFYRGDLDDDSVLTSVSRVGIVGETRKSRLPVGWNDSAKSKQMNKGCPTNSSRSTMLYIDNIAAQTKESRDKQIDENAMREKSEHDKKDKLVEIDPVSDPLPLGQGTQHIRQLSFEESQKLFKLLE